MPRYLLESQPTGAQPLAPADRDELVERNLMASVTWLCSFVGERTTYALYEGPHPEAVRRAAKVSGLEVTRVSEVRLLDPYPHPPTPPGGAHAVVHGRPHPRRERHG